MGGVRASTAVAMVWRPRKEVVPLAVAERHISRTSLPLRVCLDRPIGVVSDDQVNASGPLPTTFSLHPPKRLPAFRTESVAASGLRRSRLPLNSGRVRLRMPVCTRSRRTRSTETAQHVVNPAVDNENPTLWCLLRRLPPTHHHTHHPPPHPTPDRNLLLELVVITTRNAYLQGVRHCINTTIC